MEVFSDLIGFSVFGFLDLRGSLRASPAICSERTEKSSWSESGEFEISSFDSSSSSAISIEILFRFSSARISSKVNSSSVFFLYTFVSDLISAVIGFLSIFDLVSVSTGFSSTSDLVSVSTVFSSTSDLVSVSTGFSSTSDLVSVSTGFSSTSDLVSVSTGFSSTFDLVSVSTGFSSTSDLVSVSTVFSSTSDLVSVSTGFSSTSDLVSVSTGFSSDSILVSFDLSSVKLKSVFIVVFCAAIFSKSGLLSFFSSSGA